MRLCRCLGIAAFEPGGLSARAAHRHQALQHPAALGQLTRLVQRNPHAGLAAARQQPAQRDECHDAGDRCRAAIGQHLICGDAGLVPAALMQAHQSQP